MTETQQKHILMVDDNTTNLKCAAEVLKRSYRVSMAKSGEQALNFLNKMKPDLILLDILMPSMDGYETLKYIKDNPETAYIPVIFLTADSDRASEIKGLKMGAMDYIRKPFEPDVMLSRIEKILQIEDIKKTLTISAQKDVLTSLWNRRYMEEELEKYAKIKNIHGVFMILDMDNFKSINDNFGHIMGDAVLVKFAETMEAVCGEEDIICRIGGDEFAIFLKGEYNKAETADIASRIITGIEDKVGAITQYGHAVSVSIGISLFPEDAEAFIDLYNKADKALYYVKQNGKKGFHFFHDKEKYAFHQETNKTRLDLDEFKRYIEEKSYEKGAYQVEYDNFKNIYQFIKRYIDRTKQKVQVVLLTMNYPKELYTEQMLEMEMNNIMKAVSFSLRRGDVATQFSKSQYVVILMDTDVGNGKMVVDRVVETFYQVSDSKDIQITYDIDQMIVE